MKKLLALLTVVAITTLSATEEVKPKILIEVNPPVVDAGYDKTAKVHGIWYYLSEPKQMGKFEGLYYQDILGVVPKGKEGK